MRMGEKPNVLHWEVLSIARPECQTMPTGRCRYESVPKLNPVTWVKESKVVGCSSADILFHGQADHRREHGFYRIPLSIAHPVEYFSD